MNKQIWIISTFICSLTITIYFIVFGVDENKFAVEKHYLKIKQKIKNINLKKISQKNTYKFSQCLKKAGIAEKKKYLYQAIKYYAWALSYKKDPKIEQKLLMLEKKLYQSNKMARLYQKAQELEKLDKLDEALKYYQKLSKYGISNDLKVKIDSCYKKIESQNKIKKTYKSYQKSLITGDWDKSIKFLGQILDIQKLKEEKINIDIEEYYKVLNRIWPKIKTLLKQKRFVIALSFIKKIPFDLPKKALVSKIKTQLKNEMSYIPNGYFIMGSNLENDEKPLTQKYLKSYYIDKYEVNNEKYLFFVNSTGHQVPASWAYKKINFMDKNLPVSGVSWEDADLFSLWSGKRLPTESEWEKAARGENGQIYPWGNKWNNKFCNSLESKRKKSVAVNSYKEGISNYGCFNMIGNVLEWTADDYAPYSKNNEELIIRSGYKVARGGSWYYKADALRASNRYPLLKTVRLISVGFRCALDHINP